MVLIDSWSEEYNVRDSDIGRTGDYKGSYITCALIQMREAHQLDGNLFASLDVSTCNTYTITELAGAAKGRYANHVTRALCTTSRPLMNSPKPRCGRLASVTLLMR